MHKIPLSRESLGTVWIVANCVIDVILKMSFISTSFKNSVSFNKICIHQGTYKIERYTKITMEIHLPENKYWQLTSPARIDHPNSIKVLGNHEGNDERSLRKRGRV